MKEMTAVQYRAMWRRYRLTHAEPSPYEIRGTGPSGKPVFVKPKEPLRFRSDRRRGGGGPRKPPTHKFRPWVQFVQGGLPQ
jgi:hypothetical protein